MTGIDDIMGNDEDTIDANAEVQEIHDHLFDREGVGITNYMEERIIEKRIKWCNERDSNNITIFLRLGRTNESITRSREDSFFEGYDTPNKDFI